MTFDNALISCTFLFLFSTGSKKASVTSYHSMKEKFWTMLFNNVNPRKGFLWVGRRGGNYYPDNFFLFIEKTLKEIE